MPQEHVIPNPRTTEGASSYAEAEARLMSFIAMLENMDGNGITFMPIQALKCLAQDIESVLKPQVGPMGL